MSVHRPAAPRTSDDAPVVPVSLKYAVVERERRYLVASLPEGVTSTKEIVDRYLVGRRLPLREVRDWEPRLALTDSKDGLSFYHRLLEDAPSRLKPGGHLICEMGYMQSERISAMVNRQVWEEGRLLDDLQGIPRTIVLRKL